MSKNPVKNKRNCKKQTHKIQNWFQSGIQTHTHFWICITAFVLTSAESDAHVVCIFDQMRLIMIFLQQQNILFHANSLLTKEIALIWWKENAESQTISIEWYFRFPLFANIAHKIMHDKLYDLEWIHLLLITGRKAACAAFNLICNYNMRNY